VLAGYLLGAAVTLWGIEYQKHVARTRPAAIWTAFTISFLVKLAGLGVAPAFLYLFPALGERCDWRSLLIAYGFSAVLVLLVGSPEVARALRPKDPQSGGADSALDSRTSIRHG
jgi:hypothetical protein